MLFCYRPMDHGDKRGHLSIWQKQAQGIFRINCKQIKQLGRLPSCGKTLVLIPSSMKYLYEMYQKPHTDDLETGTDEFWIAFIQNQSRQTNPNELRMNSSLSRKCPLVPCVAFPTRFPGKLSQSFHSLERVGERSAFIISVCPVLAFKANARSSVWAPQREEGGAA